MFSANASVCRRVVPARDGDILTVGGKRFRWRKCCSSPGPRHHHCWQQTRPFRGHVSQFSVRSVPPSNAISFCVQSTRASSRSVSWFNPLTLVIWAFPWCPSGTEVSGTRHSLIVLMFVLRGQTSAREQRVGTRHSLIVLMFVLRGRPSAQCFAIVLTLLTKQKHPHCR